MQLLLFISCPVLTESINNTIIDYCWWVLECLYIYISKQENISIILWKFYNKILIIYESILLCALSEHSQFYQFKRPPTPSKIMLATLQAHNLLPQLPWQLWTYFSIVIQSQTFCVVGVLRARNFLNLLPWLSVQIFVVFFLLTPIHSSRRHVSDPSKVQVTTKITVKEL